jgi:hypothetical protein
MSANPSHSVRQLEPPRNALMNFITRSRRGGGKPIATQTLLDQPFVIMLAAFETYRAGR